jgi:HEPN domain-containing protein
MPDEEGETVQTLVAQWLAYARADLAVAQMVEDARILPEILVFHAQQAAEKALKALLVQAQLHVPRTHVIASLLELCRDAGYAGTETLDDAVMLTQYAVQTRNPGLWDR